MKFEVGQLVKAIMIDCLPGKEYAPNLKIGEEREIKDIVLDSAGNQHLDLGLKSNLNWIRSHETDEVLPRSTEVHWCHPSRVELV